MSSAVLEYGAGGFNGAVTDEGGALSLETVRRFGDEVIAPVRARISSGS